MTEGGYETSEGPAAEPAVAEAYSSEENSSVTRWLIETALLVALAFLLAQGIKSFVVQPFVIPTGSMIPTIEIGDYVLAEKLTFRFARPPQPGDVVVFDDPNDEHPQLIKRVIATGGQQLDVKDGAVYVDGARMDEPYVQGKPTLPGDLPLPIIVPEGEVWLMGDNRPNSGDSRYFGPRPLDSVRGRAFWKYWPPSEFGALD